MSIISASDINYSGIPGVMYGSTPSMSGGASNPMSAYFNSLAFSGGSIDNGNGIGAGNLSSPLASLWGNNNGGSGGSFADTGGLILGGLQAIGQLWTAWEANKLAKKRFAFQRDVTEQNLANQIQAYNTTLEDRSRSRAHTEGQSPEEAQAYIDNNRLTRTHR